MLSVGKKSISKFPSGGEMYVLQKSLHTKLSWVTRLDCPKKENKKQVWSFQCSCISRAWAFSLISTIKHSSMRNFFIRSLESCIHQQSRVLHLSPSSASEYQALLPNAQHYQNIGIWSRERLIAGPCKETRGLSPKKPLNSPKGFSKAFLKARWGGGVVGRCWLLGAGILCSHSCARRSGQLCRTFL